MNDVDLIESVRARDIQRVCACLAGGMNVHARDEDGWTALCWAAGAGDTPLVELLLDHGADVFGAARDGRTPYQIALAAGRVDAARVLAQTESIRGGAAVARSSGRAHERPYCRAYRLGDLRVWPAWSESSQRHDLELLTDESIVFLHRDYSVTRTIWPGEGVMFDDAAPEWPRFCVERLGFEPPDDFAWLPSGAR